MPSPIHIAVPAWGRDYTRLAVKYTVPSAVAALRESNFTDVTFHVWTDDKNSYLPPLDGYKAEFHTVPGGCGRAALQQSQRDPLSRQTWAAFMQCHRDAIELTPDGAICALLNSDIVSSRETFNAIEKALAPETGKKVAVSVGIRTLIDGNEPPIGVDTVALNSWIWTHLHPISQECRWSVGHSRHPSILFFEQNGEVAMHCFHLTPMFIRKDRNLKFRGTIDNDLLVKYEDHEIAWLNNGECSFAELSFGWKKHPNGAPLNINYVNEYGTRKFSQSHRRNFRQRYPVIGRPQANHPAAEKIMEMLK